MQSMRVLGLETSCDETAVAVYDGDAGLLAHEVYSQVDLHAAYGGVVPELASRDHLRKLLPLLRKVIDELDALMVRDFVKTFKAVNSEFSQLFTRLFNGGSAKLTISDESDPIESGIEIEAKLPGKREQGLALLSGGERSLAAVALVFALLKVSPTPFCVLDEVDAMLDESNVNRFCDLLISENISTTSSEVILLSLSP